jgi:transcriptional regulator with XRE-family HTH domain
MGSSWVEAFDAQRLRRLRLERNLTQTDLAVALHQSEVRANGSSPSALETAKRIGTLKVAVSNYEKVGGRQPRGPVLLALATRLNVDVLDLLHDDLPVTLQVLRAIRGMDQAAVAAALGATRAAYGHIEQGRRKQLTEAESQRLAEILQVSPTKLDEALATTRAAAATSERQSDAKLPTAS